jgi:hypothetical protein
VTEYLFDVALSYAGEDGVYVERVAHAIAAAEVACFYDQQRRVELWGKNLYDELDLIFRAKSRHVVIFISKWYVEKPWTNHERRSAQARALLESEDFLLPVRMDDTELPGLPPTVAYLDGRALTPEQVAELIVMKVRAHD